MNNLTSSDWKFWAVCLVTGLVVGTVGGLVNSRLMFGRWIWSSYYPPLFGKRRKAKWLARNFPHIHDDLDSITRAKSPPTDPTPHARKRSK